MGSILVLYHSQQYGNTEKMARAVAEGARSGGADVTVHNANNGRFDVERYRGFDAAVFGSPDYYSYLAGTLKVFLDDWYIAKSGDDTGLVDKPIGLFYSHGGGGAVKGVFEKLFGRLGYQVGRSVESLRAPSALVLDQCRELGRQLAEAAE